MCHQIIGQCIEHKDIFQDRNSVLNDLSFDGRNIILFFDFEY